MKNILLLLLATASNTTALVSSNAYAYVSVFALVVNMYVFMAIYKQYRMVGE